MKKLGKKVNNTVESIEEYCKSCSSCGCTCSCSCSGRATVHTSDDNAAWTFDSTRNEGTYSALG